MLSMRWIALWLALPLAAQAGPLLPKQFQQRYLSMSFKIGDETVRIKLKGTRYQNPKGSKPLDRAKLKDKMLSLVNSELQKDKEGIEELVKPFPIRKHSPIFHRVFMGEGKPEQIVAVLQLASRLKSKLGKYWVEKGDLSATLQHFYLENIGLNCNGFVGAYAQAVGARQNSDTQISSYAPAKKRKKKLSQIKPGDVLVWKNGSHIGAIQGKRKDGKWDVVEAGGVGRSTPPYGGLGNTVYEFKETGGDVIKAIKHVPGPKGGPMDCYIVALK